MADRFAGAVYIGGRISQETFEKIAEVVNECGVDGDLEEDGSAYFSECNYSDLSDLVKYCRESNVALMIQWDAKYEYDGLVQYWVDGKHEEYTATNDGEIVVRLSDLQKHPHMFIGDFIDSMRIPDFPNLEIEG